MEQTRNQSVSLCSIDGCSGRVHSRGLCQNHYRQAKRREKDPEVGTRKPGPKPGPTSVSHQRLTDEEKVARRVARQRARTHCAKGHEINDDNGYWRKAESYVGGRRWICRICARNWQTKYQGRALIPDDAPIAPRNGDKTHCPRGHAYAEHGRQNANGTRSCRLCQVIGRKLRTYGITEAELVALVESAAGRCEICTQEINLHIDHDHTTGTVRGLLCGNCNNGLGRFKDDPAKLRAAVIYLER